MQIQTIFSHTIDTPGTNQMCICMPNRYFRFDKLQKNTRSIIEKKHLSEEWTHLYSFFFCLFVVCICISIIVVSICISFVI